MLPGFWKLTFCPVHRNHKRLNDSQYLWSTFTVYKVLAYSIFVDVFSSLQPCDSGHAGIIIPFSFLREEVTYGSHQLISQGSKTNTYPPDFRLKNSGSFLLSHITALFLLVITWAQDCMAQGGCFWLLLAGRMSPGPAASHSRRCLHPGVLSLTDTSVKVLLLF